MNSFVVKVLQNLPESDPRVLFESEIKGAFRIGRQDGEEEPVGIAVSPSRRSQLEQKLVIASRGEREYSRHIAEIRIKGRNVEVHNISHQDFLVDDEPLSPDHRRIQAFPTQFSFNDRTVVLSKSARDHAGSIFSLPELTSPPGLQTFVPTDLSIIAAASQVQIDGQRLLELLQAMLRVFQESPNCQQFYDQAAMAMIQLLELDHVLIAFHKNHSPSFGNSPDHDHELGDWVFQSLRQRRPGRDEWLPSRNILKIVAAEKRTVYQLPDLVAESLASVACLVASPLLNSKNEMVGFIYGDRAVAGNQRLMFSEAEAKFVELFANGISIGLERLNQERKIVEMRSRFDQFFTPELARQLESDATILKPRSAQVSVLFADIRGFSRISERIGPELTINWINSVMNHLSECVFKFEGVVVNYIGDEILAMWGAPVDRENHSELAVRAALEMKARLPLINEQWQSVVGEPVKIGIGINSGAAQVGNIGSDQMFKYGPLGDVVNVASRVQSATKQLGTDLLVTESTILPLANRIVSRRIRLVRFVNVERAVAVYEIPFQPDEAWMQLKRNYETGLEFYESGKLREASQQLAGTINQFPEDGPSVHLLSDSVSGLSRNEFDPVWTLARK